MVLTHEVKPADLTNTGVASTAYSSRARTAPVNLSGTQVSGGTQGSTWTLGTAVKKQSPGDIADQRKKEYNDSITSLEAEGKNEKDRLKMDPSTGSRMSTQTNQKDKPRTVW
jgi:hypothetical protein